MSTFTGGNYGAVGQRINKQNQNINAVNMESSPDYGKIANEAIKGRSRERQAAIQAEAAVHKTGLAEMSKQKQLEINIESDKEVEKIKRPARRMAGIVGAAGTIAGSALLLKKDEEDNSHRDKYYAELDALDEKITALYNKPDEADGPDDVFEPKPFTEPYPQSGGGSSGGGSTQQTGSGSSSSSSSSGKVTPAVGKGFRGEVYNYLTQTKGLSKNKALGLMANIDRESSFQTNPSGGDGGNSFGMFQWNNTYGRSQRMKSNVKDWQTNWKGQIDYALSGNQLSEYNKVTNDFLNTTFETPQAAADYWMQHWERPAHQGRDSRRHTEILGGYNF